MVHSSEIDNALKRLGVSGFRPGQGDVVDLVMRRENVLVLMPTGAGKSLCYQLPSMLLKGTALVVSPLLALMREQVEALVSKGVRASRLDSTQTEEERLYVKNSLMSGEVDILYVSPETLQGNMMKSWLLDVNWSMFVVDEAHCLSEWGQRFRTDYLSLPRVARKLQIPVLALTATATPVVVEDLCREFKISSGNVIRIPLRKENIVREVIPVGKEERGEVLYDYFAVEGRLPALVYVNRREDAESVAAELVKRGIKARSYHAGMNAEVRAGLHREYLDDAIPVLVATTAFGMGVDKPNVRSVVHYHFPSGLEGYLQESGRAGRDGGRAYSCILACGEDMVFQKNRILSVLPSKRSVENLLSWMLPDGDREVRILSLWDASTRYDIEEVFLSRILFYLEERGYIEWVGQGKLNWKVKPLYPLKTVLHGREEDEQQLLSWLDQHGSFTLEEASKAMEMSYEEILFWLSEVEISGEWNVVSSHNIRLYRGSGGGELPKDMALELDSLFRHRVEGDLIRLDEVWNFMAGGECYNRYLERVFGEIPLKECGKCTACRNGKINMPELAKVLHWDEKDNLFIKELLDRNFLPLGSPRQLGRFLAGFLSPAAGRARLWKLSHYGAYRGYPLTELEERLILFFNVTKR